MESKLLLGVLLIIGLCFSYESEAQKTDEFEIHPEIMRLLDEIVVTATKTERQLSNTTVPVTLIKDKDINNTNALRIQGVLEEFTGLNTVSSALGTGIQMQGLDADYSLIMIDGVPIIGRLNGILDLSRLTVSNISSIEIVKGPSSVLFGSNALAGVVNIITKTAKQKQELELSAKASTFNTYDLGLNGILSHNRFKSSASVNYYTTKGYDLASHYQGYNISTDYYGKTVSPHSNYTISLNNEYKISSNTNIHLNARFFNQDESYQFLDANKDIVTGSGNVKDWSIKPWITHRFNSKLKSKLSFNKTKYLTGTDELFLNKEIYSQSFYDEQLSIIELQNEFKLNKQHEFTLGAGYEQESIQTSRLNGDQVHTADNKYLYLQYIFDYKDKLDVVLGTRYEEHQNYSSQLSPKLSFKYNISPKYILKASIGTGFKKPDFKQLYFNYTNNAIGYTVFGSTFVEEGMSQLLAQNEIAINKESGEPIIYDLYHQIVSNGGEIDAEHSVGINIGMSIRSIKNVIIDINGFRNDLNNLIETTPIALKKNGWQAYSYQNINRVFTRGLEIDFKYYFNDKYKICLGYQFVEAKDKSVVDLLEDGQLFAKDLSTGVSYKIAKNQYGGLLNRPNHNANLKFFINDLWKGIDMNFKVFYKGKFGFADLNNNQILDIKEEYVPGYFLMNTTIQKSFLEDRLFLKFGVDNIFNYTYSTPEFTISSLAGRIFYTSINYKFTKK